MASNYVCRSCIHAIRHRSSPTVVQLAVKRPYATTPVGSTAKTPQTASRKSTSRQSSDISAPESTAGKKIGQPPSTKQGTSAGAYSQGLAKTLRQRARGSTETYVAYGATETLFKECARQADYTIKRDGKGNIVGEPRVAEGGEDVGTPVGDAIWYKNLNLPCTFNTWAQISFLHMWLLTARLRLFPAEHAPSWHQHLLDHFSFEAERRMTELHAINTGMIRQRYLKDLFVQWRGCLAAYDEGLIKGDAVFASAIWRNIFGGRELQDGDIDSVAAVVGYGRYWARTLDKMDDNEIATGGVQFDETRLIKQTP